jgi:hypothetical protein
VQKEIAVNRKLTILLAALIVPGGFIALVAGFLFNRLANTEKGRKVVEVARAKAPAWASSAFALGAVNQAA